jgi:diguanylate cyclase
MPFTEVKIDRSFVIGMMTDDSCKIIVQHIIDLAGKLGLKSVAEGVEEVSALASLIASGCDLAQGYYLSRPMAADKIPLFISNRSVAQIMANISPLIGVGAIDKPLSKWRPGIWV